MNLCKVLDSLFFSENACFDVTRGAKIAALAGIAWMFSTGRDGGYFWHRAC